MVRRRRHLRDSRGARVLGGSGSLMRRCTSEWTPVCPLSRSRDCTPGLGLQGCRMSGLTCGVPSGCTSWMEDPANTRLMRSPLRSQEGSR